MNDPAAAATRPLRSAVVGAAVAARLGARCTSPARRAYTDDLPEPRGTLHAALGVEPGARTDGCAASTSRRCAPRPASST